MRTLIVLAPHPDLANAVRAALNPDKYRLIHRISLEEAEPVLAQGRIDAAILDVELANVQGIWVLEKLHRRLPSVPIVAFSASREWQWEEEAYLQGVSYLLTKPVRPRLLNAMLDRFWAAALPPRVEPRPAPVRSPAPVSLAGSLEERSSTRLGRSAAETLSVLRDFSGILTHSLCAEALLKQFLLLLREILGVNRAVVFLRPPNSIVVGASPAAEARRMRSACALGMSPGLLEHFELSFETGIGGHLFREGRILRRDGAEVSSDIEILKEFELLHAQVAIPILDRENLVGVAAFDGRVTGEPIANGELELILHLLEELGMAVKNIWLHDQLAANNEMMTDILRELTSACVVVSRDLNILHANKAARSLFKRPGPHSRELEFTDLPEALGSKIYQVLRTGTGLATFRHQTTETPERLYHVSVVPFVQGGSPTPYAALLVVEDHTQVEALRKLELETGSLRLVRSMAERLAHEIGNTMVPLSTHQQLLGERFKDPEFRASLDTAMSDSVKRVSRLISQMRYLARDSVVNTEAVALSQLVEEAYKDARTHQPAKSARLEFENGQQPIILMGDHGALRHALAEVMLNAIQANSTNPRVAIHAKTDNDTEGQGWIQIDITDNGSGFAPEVAQRVPSPFFTTRTVGLGLGLCVARKIVEVHHGRLAIVNPTAGKPATVRISLPLGTPPHANS